MNELDHQINLALRTAAGHERAARDAEAAGEKQYVMKMKSAGASSFEAFALAARAAPEHHGRKIDDKALVRLYQSPKHRPWWTVHLAVVKVEGKPASTEWASRLIQWHLDPDAAMARRAVSNVRRIANHRKNLEKQGEHGGRPPRTDVGPTTAEFRELRDAGREGALAGRELPKLESTATRDDLHGEILRIKSAISKLTEPHQLAAALDTLQRAAREIERL